MQPTISAPLSASSFSHPLAQNRALRTQAAAKGASGVEIAVLLALADFRNDHGSAWPSLPTLVRQSGFADKTVRRALARLRALGLLHVVLPATPRTSTRYRVVQPSQQTGQSDQSDRSERPVKFPEKQPEEIKTRAHAQPEAPVRGAVSHSRAGLLAENRDAAPVPSPRAARSAQNKLEWAARPKPGPTRVRAPAAPGAPQGARYKPYQLPLPQGPLLRDMDPSARAELFKQVRELRSATLAVY